MGLPVLQTLALTAHPVAALGENALGGAFSNFVEGATARLRLSHEEWPASTQIGNGLSHAKHWETTVLHF